MKKLLFASVILSSLISCKKDAVTTETKIDTIAVKATAVTPKDETAANDEAAIATAIHEFYKWYAIFASDEKRNVIYIDDSGKDRVLDEDMLETFYAGLKSSGVISDELIDADRKLMRECAKVWLKEGKDGPPACLDMDRFYCSQDYVTDFYTKAPVVIQKRDGDKVTALMAETTDEYTLEQKLNLKKENGRWMITKIYCLDAPPM